MPLSLSSSERSPQVFTLSLAGSLDSNTYSVLEQKVDYLIGEGEAKVINFDMAGVDYISSMGVRVILKAQKDLKKRGGHLTMMNLRPQIERVFKIINALPSLQIFSSIEELDDYLTEMQRQAIQGKD
jgi:anti-sigma B factor antagonist